MNHYVAKLPVKKIFSKAKKKKNTKKVKNEKKIRTSSEKIFLNEQRPKRDLIRKSKAKSPYHFIFPSYSCHGSSQTSFFFQNLKP